MPERQRKSYFPWEVIDNWSDERWVWLCLAPPGAAELVIELLVSLSVPQSDFWWYCHVFLRLGRRVENQLLPSSCPCVFHVSGECQGLLRAAPCAGLPSIPLFAFICSPVSLSSLLVGAALLPVVLGRYRGQTLMSPPMSQTSAFSVARHTVPQGRVRLWFSTREMEPQKEHWVWGSHPHELPWAAGNAKTWCVGHGINRMTDSPPKRGVGQKKVADELCGCLRRLSLWADRVPLHLLIFPDFLFCHWHPVWWLPTKSNLWHHLDKTSERRCGRTRVYHSFILGFPQHVTGCINSDMIPAWPGL